MVEILSILTLFVIVIAEFIYLYYITEKFDRRLNDLLNRLMAADYQTYVQGEIAQSPPEPEIEYEDRGIPV